MSTPIYATADDVKDRLKRPITDDEYRLAEILVEDASRYVRNRFPTLQARIDGATLDPEDVRMVVASMVKRAITVDDEGVTQQMNMGGIYQQSNTFANPMGDLYLKPTETALLAETGTAGRVRSVRVTTE